MGADLNNIVKCQKLTDDHVQFLIYQILRGLKVGEAPTVMQSFFFFTREWKSKVFFHRLKICFLAISYLLTFDTWHSNSKVIRIKVKFLKCLIQVFFNRTRYLRLVAMTAWLAELIKSCVVRLDIYDQAAYTEVVFK